LSPIFPFKLENFWRDNGGESGIGGMSMRRSTSPKMETVKLEPKPKQTGSTALNFRSELNSWQSQNQRN
jgi:hypothetical protein